jgi:hypothetical protein
LLLTFHCPLSKFCSTDNVLHLSAPSTVFLHVFL